jgi:hypothetical protein
MKKIVFLSIWILLIASKCDNDIMITSDIDKELDLIKTKGTPLQNDDILFDFNKYASDLGLDVEFSVFQDLKKSHSAIQLENGETKRVPTISIYLKTTKNFVENGIDNQDHNWSSEYKYTTELIQHWNELLDKYNYSQDYKSEKMLIFIYSLEELITSKIVYLSKQQVIDWIDNKGINPKPEYVFSSSTPCYNIVFRNESDYNVFLRDFEPKLTSGIQNILESNNDYKYFKKQKVKINYLHKEMEGINLYGLSRQD